MTFRSIGTLAGDVLRKAERSANRRAHKFTLDTQDSREAKPGIQRAQHEVAPPLVDGEGPSRAGSGMGENGPSTKPGPVVQGAVNNPAKRAGRKLPDIAGLPVGREMIIASQSNEGLPPPSAVVISLAMWRHAEKPSASA